MMNAVCPTLCVVSMHIVTTRKARLAVYVRMDIGEILIKNVYVSRKSRENRKIVTSFVVNYKAHVHAFELNVECAKFINFLTFI